MSGDDSHERGEHPLQLLDVVALRHLGDLIVQLVQLVLVDPHAARRHHVGRAGEDEEDEEEISSDTV